MNILIDGILESQLNPGQYERTYDVASAWNPQTHWLSDKTMQSTTDMPATTYIISEIAGCCEGYEWYSEPLHLCLRRRNNPRP